MIIFFLFANRNSKYSWTQYIKSLKCQPKVQSWISMIQILLLKLGVMNKNRNGTYINRNRVNSHYDFTSKENLSRCVFILPAMNINVFTNLNSNGSVIPSGSFSRNTTDHEYPTYFLVVFLVHKFLFIYRFWPTS